MKEKNKKKQRQEKRNECGGCLSRDSLVGRPGMTAAAAGLEDWCGLLASTRRRSARDCGRPTGCQHREPGFFPLVLA